MADNYPGLPPPCNTPSYPPGGDEAAELEAVPTIPSGPAQHTDHELILTICDLVSNPRGSWSGTTAEMLESASRAGHLMDVTTEQVDRTLEELEDLLFELHQVQHILLGDGFKEDVLHVFWLQE